MSTLWTPGGERPIRREEPASPEPMAGTASPETAGREPTEAEIEAEMARLAGQLADTPVEVVVANHAYGLFQLASLHLSTTPPRLPQASLAIDAFAALVEGLPGRLGDAEPDLTEALAQLRMAYVHIHNAAGAEPDTATPPG